MLLKFFLWLNSKFPGIPHPFNRPNRTESDSVLPYAEFEFEQAPKLLDLYNRTFQKRGMDFQSWIRGKKIADFCCGGGGKSVYFAKLGAARVTGLDLNPIFIEQAEKLAEKKGVSGECEFFLRDVCDTSFQDASFDAVIFNDAIDHIENPKRAIDEALRILRPGGLIFVNFESYYFPWGHHLLDAIRIPWIHLFTSEAFRIKLYKAIVEKFPDGKERLKFRLGRDEKGRERITYLNHLTIRKFQKILESYGSGREHRNLRTLAFHKVPLRRKPLQLLSKVPGISEFFLSTHIWILEKSKIS